MAFNTQLNYPDSLTTTGQGLLGTNTMPLLCKMLSVEAHQWRTDVGGRQKRATR